MLKYVRKYSPTIVTLDYCQFGELWKKPTSILGCFWNMQPLAKRCSSHNKSCSRTQRPHTILSGRDGAGNFWTLRAQPYPWSFATSVATQVAIALQWLHCRDLGMMLKWSILRCFRWNLGAFSEWVSLCPTWIFSSNSCQTVALWQQKKRHCDRESYICVVIC